MSAEAIVPDDKPSHVGSSHSGTFPGDPCFEANVFMPTKEDVRALKKMSGLLVLTSWI